MKKLLIILLVVNVQLLFSQEPCDSYCLNFEDTLCQHHLTIDTANFPQTIWQIGQPQKFMFDQAASIPNVIITDTSQTYPVSNYSVFTIQNTVNMGYYYGIRMFLGQYNVQSDSLKDYGMMEFSPDNGMTWIDMINDRNYYPTFIWNSQKPVLTGNSNGWKFFDISMADIGSAFDLQIGDTVLIRFTFISDSIPETLGGLMYDNLCFSDYVEGISETRFKSIISTIHPNPSNTVFTIEFENLNDASFQLSVYDIHSKPVLTINNILDNYIVVDASSFLPGVYVYKLTNQKAAERSWGKIIVSK